MVGAGLVGRGADRPRTEAGAGPVGRRDVERGSDDRDVGPPRLELFDLGQERPVPERHQSRVRPGRAARPCPAECLAAAADRRADGPCGDSTAGCARRFRLRPATDASASRRCSGIGRLAQSRWRPRRRRCGRAQRSAPAVSVVTPQHAETEREARRPDALACHRDAHRVAPANRCQVVDLGVHQLDVVTGGDQTRGTSHRGGRGIRCTPRRTRSGSGR